MFGNLIWSQFGFAFNWPFGAALSFILLGHLRDDPRPHLAVRLHGRRVPQ